MEIFVRLFVWILNHTYRRPKRVESSNKIPWFYSGKNIARVIAKSQFSSCQEIRAFRRVVRRQIADNALLND